MSGSHVGDMVNAAIESGERATRQLLTLALNDYYSLEENACDTCRDLLDQWWDVYGLGLAMSPDIYTVAFDQHIGR